ncbi:MAG: hypothetical protein WA777_11125 [Rhodanobacter sp.]
MKSHTPLSVILASSTVLMMATPLAYSHPAMQPSAQDQSSTMSSAPSTNSATYNTSQGQVTLNSTMGSAPAIGTPPSFEQLSGGGKSITPDQAAAYPPLANDFEHANTSRSGHLSKAEYERWLKHLQ